jgi:hypothetical protein
MLDQNDGLSSTAVNPHSCIPFIFNYLNNESGEAQQLQGKSKGATPYLNERQNDEANDRMEEAGNVTESTRDEVKTASDRQTTN